MQFATLCLQEERKGFEQLDEEDRTKPLAQIYPSLRQVALSCHTEAVQPQRETAHLHRRCMHLSTLYHVI